ncbi:MAG: DEAD/DEAH box helicase [Planctomycetes bacterium]|nr:DEAD/DEAH box helicase [Planctomycetota bacterium]
MASDATLTFPGPCPSPERALLTLGDPYAAWFRETIGVPTAAQCQAWPSLHRGENLLVAAPTASGKTLAAFLPIIKKLTGMTKADGVAGAESSKPRTLGLTEPRPLGSSPLPRFLTGAALTALPGLRTASAPATRLACLYITPLKALSRDAAKNLRRHLQELRRFDPRLRTIRVGLRTGDSSAKARRLHLERPPHILLTTPESLAIMLSQSRWCDVFRNLRWVVVDEVHALIGNKRGADLALSLERLETLVAERHPSRALQRIGLSGTCVPLDIAARFLVGVGRRCTIAHQADRAPMELIVEHLPAERGDSARPAGFMARLIERLTPELARNRTTLIFTNIRSIAERLTWVLRRRFPSWTEQIAVHHSSLAVERRRRVERRLKKGKLRVVVTSTSLELGIDIGSVDSVVFVHPPGGVARTIQRLGRSGHKPGQPRRGLFLTAGIAELLEATVTAASGSAGQLEPLKVVDEPHDVLCQHLVGMAMTGWRSRSETLNIIRRAFPYRKLNEADFEHCLAYLSGKKSNGADWLPSRLQWRGNEFAIINQWTASLLRRNFGSIINEEPRAIRLLIPASDNNTEPRSLPVGTVEEAYADRLRPGDRFVLDGRCFQFRRHEDGALLVEEVAGSPIVPHWTTGGWHLAPELARRLFVFRCQAAEALRDGLQAFADFLRLEYGLEDAGIAELTRLFLMQETISEIPALDCLLIESIDNDARQEVYFHTPLSRAANDAMARVLAWRLYRERGLEGPAVVADLGFMLSLPTCQPLTPDAWRGLLAAERFADDLSEAVSESPSLRDRFARVAMTGLMVLRQPWGGRRKVGGRDWVQRRLFEQVRHHEPDFVLLRQAEREVHREVCDAPAALSFLEALPSMEVRFRSLSEVSPFAAAWTQPAQISAELAETPGNVLERLHHQLVG